MKAATTTRKTKRKPAAPRSGNALFGVNAEYGLHCLLWLLQEREKPASARDLAELQGVSPSLLAKILPRFEKAGLVVSSGGINGGYRLARPGAQISMLDVVDAIDGDKRLFDCKEVRRNCALFEREPPSWSSRGTCGIHAVMLRAEKAMRAELARTSLQDLAAGVKWPAQFGEQVVRWFDDRSSARESARLKAMRSGRQRSASS